jgi:hypothetical protein
MHNPLRGPIVDDVREETAPASQAAEIGHRQQSFSVAL